MMSVPVSIDALDLDGSTCNRFLHANDQQQPTNDRTPSPSPRPITTSDLFFPSKIAQFRSEYQLKDRLKEPQPFESIPHQINEYNPNSLTPNRSLSKILTDQTLEPIDRTATPTRRYSSSDIDQQSMHLAEFNTHLIEQQKKRRIYYFNHTLFSTIYKRTQRLSSAESHLYHNPLNNRERHSRHRRQDVIESDVADEPTTSDSVYIRALEKTTLNPTYRSAFSAPDGGENRRISTNISSHSKLSNSGNVSDTPGENHPLAQKPSKSNGESNNRSKRISFLAARRRASYFPTGTSNILSEEQKRKRDVVWPLKRSYSFDTPFHRETIEALNKGK